MRATFALIATVLLGLTLSPLDGQSASAAQVGYLRLAHLSPDTPNVDVYLSSQSGGMPEKVIRGVGYGVMSDYLSLPVGGYRVAMRASGAPSTEPPVLTTQVSLASQKAYTVAGVGRHAELGLRVLADDLALPSPGKARVRIMHASVRVPVLGVSLPDGTSIAENVAFATTTDYHQVAAGDWRLTIRPLDGQASTPAQAALKAGNVYSLVILDGGTSLRTQLHLDASAHGPIPVGGVDTGAGGSAVNDAPRTPLAWWIAALAVLLAIGATGYALQFSGTGARLAARPTPNAPATPASTPVSTTAPTRLRITRLGVQAPLVKLRLDRTGKLQVPEDFQRPGWYADGTIPGDKGPAVIAGHVDSRDGHAVFHRLSELRPGDLVEVERDGRWIAFQVVSSMQRSKEDFPAVEVYGPTPDPQLRLITCDGEFDRARRSYRDNIIVFAVAASR